MKNDRVSSYQEIRYVLNENDPYKIMGVADYSEIETITKVYRELAKKYHPDRLSHISNKEELNELKIIFTKITGAFNLLKDPEIKNRLDLEKKVYAAKEEHTILMMMAKEKANKDRTTINISSSGLNKVVKEDGKVKKLTQAEGFFNNGLTLYNYGKLEESINNFQSAIKIEATIPKYHSYLGLAMKKKGWEGYAQAEFKVALHYDPKDKIAMENYKGSVKQTNESKQDEIKTGFFGNLTSKFFKKS